MLKVEPHIRGLIFDCDGTLADTLAVHYQAWMDTFADYGVVCPADFLVQFNGVPTAKIVAYFNQTFGYELDTERFAVIKEQRVQKYLPSVKPIQAIYEVAVHYKGKLPMAVASGSPRMNVELTLTAIGLGDHFHAIVTADDPVAPKPAPDIFLEAARRINIEPTLCQVFEDADHGLEGARRAGMVALDVRPFYQSLLTQ